MLATFYRPDARALPHPDRGRGVPVRPLRRRSPRSRHHGLDPRDARRASAARARARTRCAPRTSWPARSGRATRSRSCCSAASTTSPGQLLDIPADHGRGAPAPGARRRLRPGARRRQRAAAAARLGRRFRRVVLVQVPQRRARAPSAGCFVHERHGARHRACRASPAGGATTRRRASACGRSSCPAPGADGWQVSQPADPRRWRPLRASLRALRRGRHAGAARASRERLTGYLESPARPRSPPRRRSSILTPRDPARARLPAVAARRRRTRRKLAARAARRARGRLRLPRAGRDPRRPGAALQHLPRVSGASPTR